MVLCAMENCCRETIDDAMSLISGSTAPTTSVFMGVRIEIISVYPCRGRAARRRPAFSGVRQGYTDRGPRPVQYFSKTSCRGHFFMSGLSSRSTFYNTWDPSFEALFMETIGYTDFPLEDLIPWRPHKARPPEIQSFPLSNRSLFFASRQGNRSCSCYFHNSQGFQHI